MESTWETCDLVVLDAAVQNHDEHAGGSYPQGSDLAQMTGLPAEDVVRAMAALESDGYIAVERTIGDQTNVWVSAVSGDANRVVGQWPTPERLADRLVAALAEAAEPEADKERRGCLKKDGCLCRRRRPRPRRPVAATAIATQIAR